MGRERRKSLCGCWMAHNTHPGLDLRESAMHGWPGHDKHVLATHAWCYLCCPNNGAARPDAVAAVSHTAEASTRSSEV